MGGLRIFGEPAFKVQHSGPLPGYGMFLELRVGLSQCCISTQPISTWWGIPLSTMTFTQRAKATGRSPKGPEGVPASPPARGWWWWIGEEMATSWVEWNSCLCKEVEHLLPHFGEAASPLHEFESQESGWSICIGKNQYHWERGDDLLRTGQELGFQNWETATDSSTHDALNGCARRTSLMRLWRCMWHTMVLSRMSQSSLPLGRGKTDNIFFLRGVEVLHLSWSVR